MKVTCNDLNKDWLRLVKKELESSGHNLSNLSDDEISIKFYSLEKRSISIKPRKVLKSKDFVCPPNLQEGLELLENRIKNGDDLRQYLSRKLKNINDSDGLLFDWSIYHLHLGIVKEADGFVERTGPLLYARFDDEFAYFINIFNHGAWTMQSLLKSVHQNWPNSIERFRLKDVIGVETVFSDKEIGHLRNANINTVIEVEPGVVYAGPGMGFTASGDSIDSVDKHIDRITGLEDLEKNIKQNALQLLQALFTDLSFIKEENLHFELIRESGEFHLFEKKNQFILRLAN